MEIREIQAELERLKVLTAEWGEEIPQIERELVLQKLRSLYEAVRFADFKAEAEVKSEPDSLPMPLPVSEPESKEEMLTAEEVEEELVAFDFDMIPLEDEEEPLTPMEDEEAIEEVEEELDQEPIHPFVQEPEIPAAAPEESGVSVEVTDDNLVEDRFDEEVNEELAEVLEENPEVMEEIEPDITEEDEVIMKPESEPEPQPVQNNLFDLEEVPVVRRSSRRVLKSLYGEPEPPKPAPHSETLEELVRREDPAPQPAPVPVPEEPKTPEVHPVEAKPEEPQVVAPVLGEVLRSEERTLADTVMPTPSVGSTLGNGSSLEGMIALNDRFFLMRELFNNDKGAYEAGIAQLDHQPSLDDCIIYIAEEHPEWSPSSDGVKLLLELLERKYGEN